MNDPGNVTPFRRRRCAVDTDASEATGNAHAAEFFQNMRCGIPLQVAIHAAADALAHDISELGRDARLQGGAEIAAFLDTVFEAMSYEGEKPGGAA